MYNEYNDNFKYIENGEFMRNLEELLSKLKIEVELKIDQNGVLDLEYLHLDEDNLVSIIKALQGNTSLKYLDISGNIITNDVALAIEDLLETNDQLIELAMQSCGIDEVSIVPIARALSSNSTLQILDIEVNKIGFNGLNILEEEIGKNPKSSL